MPHVTIFDTAADAAVRAAEDWMADIERGARVLGLATGSSVIGFYAEWGRRMAGDARLKELTTFNLDEYYGIGQGHPGTFRRFMETMLFERLGLPSSVVHFLPADPMSDVDQVCIAYDAALEASGGLDACLLGIGQNGHLGFNEPCTPFESRTHLAALTDDTRAANREGFPGPQVPERALTMGLASIAAASRLTLLAFGRAKADAVHRALTGPVDPSLPASLLQRHPNASLYLDREAAARL
jgi:glucosamine-6-phosphate deaminase